MADQKPRFCPGCGAPLSELVETRAAVEFVGENGPAWDCQCYVCGWSGNISPDVEMGDG